MSSVGRSNLGIGLLMSRRETEEEERFSFPLFLKPLVVLFGN